MNQSQVAASTRAEDRHTLAALKRAKDALIKFVAKTEAEFARKWRTA